MKTFIIVNNLENLKANTANDIQVKNIYGIYQNKEKSFWECKTANVKLLDESNTNNLELLNTFVIKEIDLDTDNIITTYKMESKTSIIDINSKKKYKIPVIYKSNKNLNNLHYK